MTPRGAPERQVPRPVPARFDAGSSQATPAAFPELPQIEDVVDGLWGRVAVGDPDACWLWQGPRDLDGYGRCYVRGRGNNKAKAARRVMEATVGRVLLRAELVLHSCDNPPCLNPAHLRIGTYSDNERDKIARGRLPVPRTHCTKGHPYPDSVTRRGRYFRRCLVCHNAKVRERYHRARMNSAAGHGGVGPARRIATGCR